MSTVRNAGDFLLEARRLRLDYERKYGPQVTAIRAKYAETPVGRTPDSVLAQLEYHARCYVVNGLLAALNWRLETTPEDGLPPLVGEAPVRSNRKATVRFLDYLGVERKTLRPLLVVETKRPAATLPRLVESAPESRDDVPLAVVCRGLAGEPLLGEWSKWLDDLRDYVRSLHSRSGNVPVRVMITNGDWMVIFLAPDNAFLAEVEIDPSRIVVFSDWRDIDRRHAELFSHLEYSRVADQAPVLSVGDVGFHVDGQYVDRAMHGLRLKYSEKAGNYASWPSISVSPVVHIRSQFGTWLRIEEPGWC